MYSESDLPSETGEYTPLTDSEDDEREVVWVDRNNPPVSGLQNMDSIVEEKLDNDNYIEMAYHLLFEADGSVVRGALGDEWEPEDEGERESLPVLSNLLDVYAPYVPPPPTSNTTAASTTTAADHLAQSVVTVAAAADNEKHGADEAPVLLYKPSPASRFLQENLSACILIPVGPTVNRRELCDKHGALAEGEKGLDFSVGYVDRDPYGWALPVSTDTDVLAKVMALYPGARPATEADVKYFMRSSHGDVVRRERTADGAIVTRTAAERVAAAAGGELPPPPATQLIKISRFLSKRTGSAEALLSCVAEAGGWRSVRWVAYDVEVALSTKGTVPLPVEFAFVPADKRKSIVHFFTHPGRLDGDAEIQAKYTAAVVHGIPVDGAKFLRRDYGHLARLVDDRYLRDSRVILINKGAPDSPALVEPQAIRWLFAAAAMTAETEEEAARFTTPDPGEICCFDVSALEAALRQSFPAAEDGGTTTPPKPKDDRTGKRPNHHHRLRGRPQSCWYHKKMRPLWADKDPRHCAQDDAWRLRDVVATLLKRIPDSGAPTE